MKLNIILTIPVDAVDEPDGIESVLNLLASAIARKPPERQAECIQWLEEYARVKVVRVKRWRKRPGAKARGGEG